MAYGTPRSLDDVEGYYTHIRRGNAPPPELLAELVGRYEVGRDRRALPAMALSSDASVVTALANDTGFTQVFARQVEAFGRPGDVAVGLTTSGTSGNVLSGLETARRLGLGTIAFTGRAAGLALPADVHVAVPSDRTPRVQEVHGTLLRIVCELIEAGMGDG